MSLPNFVKRWARYSRAALMPMGSPESHLCLVARRTARELGIHPGAAADLERRLSTTCQELWTVGTNTDRDLHRAP